MVESVSGNENEDVDEQAAIQRTEAAVMERITPIGFAVILDRISSLLETGTRTGQHGLLPPSSPASTVEKVEYYEDDGGAGDERLRYMKSGLNQSHLKTLQYRAKSEAWSPTSSTSDSDSTSKLVNKLLQKEDAGRCDIAEQIHALRYLQEILSAAEKVAGLMGLANADSREQRSHLRRTVSSWRKQKKEIPGGNKGEGRSFMAKAFWGMGRKPTLTGDNSEVATKCRSRHRKTTDDVSANSETNAEVSEHEQSEVQDPVAELLARTLAQSQYERFNIDTRAVSEPEMVCVPGLVGINTAKRVSTDALSHESVHKSSSE